MFCLTAAESDADLERWRQVRVAVAPGARAATVGEMRGWEDPGRLLLAEQDGQLVGSGVADNSDLRGRICRPSGPARGPAPRRWHSPAAGPGAALRGSGSCQGRGRR